MPTKKTAAGAGVKTYNLRQRKKVENQTKDAPKTRSSSKIPIPKKSGQSEKTQAANITKKTKPRAVPDFKKLHQDWNDKFNKGKAINKKTCTQIQAFDLTRPVTRSQHKAVNDAIGFDDHDEDLDDDALQNILDVVDKSSSHIESVANSISPSVLQSKNVQEVMKYIETESKPNREKAMKTKQGFGDSEKQNQSRDKLQAGSFAVKAEIKSSKNVLQPRQHQTAEVKTKVLSDHNMKAVKGMIADKENKPESKPGKQKPSLKDMQKEFDIEFESDASALKSILNNTGVSHARHHMIGRQTTAGISSAKYNVIHSDKIRLRTSIYDRPIRMSIYDRRWTKSNIRSHLPSKALTKTPSPVKPILATPARVLVQRNQNQIVTKTPGTPSRVINPKFSSLLPGVESSSTKSPAIRKTVDRPTPQRVARQCSSKKVRWAEVLKSPENEHTITDNDTVDKVVTTLKFTDDDEQTTAGTEGKSDTMTEAYLQKVIELEEQLLQEIHKLQEEKQPDQSKGSKTLPTNQQTILKRVPEVANHALDLRRKETLIYDTGNGNLPVDLSVKTPSRPQNYSHSSNLFKHPLPKDETHSNFSQSLKTERILQLSDHNSCTPVRAVSSRLEEAIAGSDASPTVLTNTSEPLDLTYCLSNIPRSHRTIANTFESKVPNTNLPNSFPSELYSCKDIQLEINKINNCLMSGGQMSHQKKLQEWKPGQNNLAFSMPSQNIGEGKVLGQDTLDGRMLSLHNADVKTENSENRTLNTFTNMLSRQRFPGDCHTPSLKARSLHDKDLCEEVGKNLGGYRTSQCAPSQSHQSSKLETLELETHNHVDLISEHVSSISQRNVDDIAKCETVKSTTTSAGIIGLKPKSSDWQGSICSSLPLIGTEDAQIISSTPQVAIESTITQPLSVAWGDYVPLSAQGIPCQLLSDDQYYKSVSEGSVNNIVTPIVRQRERLHGQSRMILSPVPRYGNKLHGKGENCESSRPGEAVNQSVLDNNKDKTNSCRSGVSLTHAQKLDHAIKMAMDIGKYEEVILNEEVALFACRLTSKFSPKAKVPHNFSNPVGSILLHGDEKHFIPISESTGLRALPFPGSAFMALKH